MMDGYIINVPMLMKLGPQWDKRLLSDVIVWVNIYAGGLLSSLICCVDLLQTDATWDTLVTALRDCCTKALACTLSPWLLRVLLKLGLLKLLNALYTASMTATVLSRFVSYTIY
jgi:hypothetical protein